MVNRFALILALSSALVAGGSFARPATPPDPIPNQTSPPTITVQAPTVIETQTYRFVQSYAAAPNPGIDQIGRWRAPVCIVVWGLPVAEQAAKIKTRIETLAQSLGLHTAAAGCKPNVEIAFEDDPQASMDGVARNDHVQYLLGYYHLSRARQLKTVTHAIQAWYVTGSHSSAGNIAGLVGSGVSPRFYMYSDVVDDPENPNPAGCFSRFTACMNSEFRNVLIVADNRALRGVQLSAVADDMAMLALSQPASLDGCYALPSVIERFASTPCAERAPPEGLTPADTAYLSALYSADLESRKRFEQTDMATRMAATLVKASVRAPGAADDAQ